MVELRWLQDSKIIKIGSYSLYVEKSNFIAAIYLAQQKILRIITYVKLDRR